MSLTKKQIEDFAKNVGMMMNGVTTVADTKGIMNRELEAIYNVGYVNYNAGQFDKAETVFKFLCMIEHTNHKYWTALGAVRQAKKDYAKAIEAYASAAIFDMNDPKPHLYSAECAVMLGNLDMAESGVVSLLGLCPPGVGRNNEYREKALNLQKVIKGLREKAETAQEGGK